MTVATTVARTVVTGNGSATSFAYTFKIDANSDLVVTKTDADGADTTLILGTHYSVAGAGGASGGTITYPLSGSALASGERLTLRRVVALTQEIDLTNQGAFYAEVHEDHFDTSRMVDQQLQEQVDRSLRFAASDQASGQLPNAAARANRVLMFDADGAPEVGDYVGGAGGLFTASGVGAVARTFLARGREVVSVKDFGAVGDGTTNDTAAFQAALDAIAGAGVDCLAALAVPPGSYRITSTLSVTGRNNLRLRGEDPGLSILRGDFNGNVVEFHECSYCTVERIHVQHGGGYTGAGLGFFGACGSNLVDRCAFANNSTNGLVWAGDLANQQSGCRTTRCLFLGNGTQQLLYFYSQDGEVENCAFGFGSDPAATVGCYFHHSNAGHYNMNEHWNNFHAFDMRDSHWVRIVNNRFEESYQHAVILAECSECVVANNLFHTNGQAATGTYSALVLAEACHHMTVIGNHFTSWNSGTYQHLHSVVAHNDCDTLNIVGNMSRFNSGTNIETGTATNVTAANNVP